MNKRSDVKRNEEKLTLSYLTKEYVKKKRSAYDIGFDNDLSFITVLRYLRKAGIEVRGRSRFNGGKTTPINKTEIKTLQFSGYNTNEISKKLKTSYSKVYYQTVTKTKTVKG